MITNIVVGAISFADHVRAKLTLWFRKNKYKICSQFSYEAIIGITLHQIFYVLDKTFQSLVAYWFLVFLDGMRPFIDLVLEGNFQVFSF